MSEALTLARPYARAAYELAAKEQNVPMWHTALEFAGNVAGDTRVATLLGDAKISLADKIKFLVRDSQSSATFERFLAELDSNDRLTLLPEVAVLFGQIRGTREQAIVVKVRSAAPIDEIRRDRLVSALARRFGKLVTMEVEIDESLIAGAVIDADAVVIDGSMQAHLRRFKKELAA